MTEGMFVVDWAAIEQKLSSLFAPGCDPYRAGAAALLAKSPDAISQDERDIVKRVYMHIAARRGQSEQTARRAADMFHEILSALSAENLIADSRNAIMADKLREKTRSRDQLMKLAGEGFELCVRSLAAMGASDVTIHECGEEAFGERPWGSDPS
jgi:hypothetical protein